MSEVRITVKQMRRLQTLWGIFARRAQMDSKDRDIRLGWIAGIIGRQISTAKELTAEETKKVIDELQRHLPAEFLKRRRASRELARDYGTAGRRGYASKTVRMADAATLEKIATLRDKIGWTQERLDAFFLSAKSPLRPRRREIRTLADANKVMWVLKSMLRRQANGAPETMGETATP